MELLKLAVSLISIDSVYLYFVGKPSFETTIKNITSSEMKINLFGAVMSYIFLLIGIKYFIIDQKRTPEEAFLLGLVIYGVFDMTNLAIFDKYSINVALMDMLWGATLFYIVAKINTTNLKI
jgi:uncharacterized membrane protein